MTSVIVPAHDEEATITRLLSALFDDAAPGELEVVVVCNGCRDRTAAVARDAVRSHQADVTVEEIPEASKIAALVRGDELARGFPRVYVDADVVVRTRDVRALAAALRRPGVEASAPTRVLPLSDVNPLVRWYYQVWQELPQVRSGLFGRGVIAVSEAGHRRLAWSTESSSDDLAVSESFAESERAVVQDATVVVRPPRTVGDLVRRRIRVVEGNVQADAAGLRGDSARTGLRQLGDVVREHPRLAPRLLVFVGVTLAARLGHRRRRRRGDTTWLRDDSSRRPG